MMAYAAKCKSSQPCIFLFILVLNIGHEGGGSNILIKIKKDENSKKIKNKNKCQI